MTDRPDRLGQANRLPEPVAVCSGDISGAVRLPEPVRVELDRAVGAWSRLPARRADRRRPAMAAAIGQLGLLGPYAAAPPWVGDVMAGEQLRVVTWDACVDQAGDAAVIDVLVALRAALAERDDSPFPR